MKTTEQTLKEQIKKLYKRVNALHREYGALDKVFLKGIAMDDDLNIITYDGKLQFYLHDKVLQGFFDTSSALYKIWETL